MLIAALVTLLLLWLLHFFLTNRKWFSLPGPGLLLPVVGHLHRLGNNEFKIDPVGAMRSLYLKYQRGGVLWVRMFNLDMAFVGDFQTVKQLFNDPDIQGRPAGHGNFKKILRHERMLEGDIEMPGVLQSEGAVWVEQRRFTLKTLRDFGFGKAGMEEMITQEVEQFIDEIKKTEGEPFDFINKFNLPILNALWHVLVGQRFEYDDPRLVSIIERLTDWFKRVAEPTAILVFAYPWVVDIYPQFMNHHKNLEINHDIMKLMMSNIKEHEESLDPNEPRDLIDKVLIEISRTTDPTSSFYGDFGKQNLANSLFDMFLAGSETTSTTLTWAMLYMARYPHIQEKVHEELDRVVGRGRMPSIQDKSNLPYTEAVVMEFQRYSNIVPNGVGHSSKKDVVVNGLTIPAGTPLIPLMSELLKGSYWEDGTTFRPERFIDTEGRCKKDEHMMAFSIGRRQCLGETLAKAELFLFFSGILQQFNISPETEGVPPSEEYNNGVTILPKPFKLRLSSRL